VKLPAGYHLNPAAPQHYRVSLENGSQLLGFKSEAASSSDWHGREVSKAGKDFKLPLTVPIHSFGTGATDLNVQFSFVYCREDNTGTCRIKTLNWRVPVKVVANSPTSAISVVGKVGAE